MWRFVFALIGCRHVPPGTVIIQDGMYSPGFQPAPVYGPGYYDPFGQALEAQVGMAYQLQQDRMLQQDAATRAATYLANQERERRQAVEVQLATKLNELANAKRALSTMKADRNATAVQLRAAQASVAAIQAEYDAYVDATSTPTPEAPQ